MKKWIVSLVLMTCIGFYGTAQQDIRGPIANPAPGVLDGVYVQEHIPTKKVIPYEYVREADVTWSKRVWRTIDLREKFNHPLYYPLDDLREGTGDVDWVWKRNPTRWSLWTIIRYHVFSGDLTAYSPFDPDWFEWQDGDLFKYPITSDKYGLGPNGTPLTDSLLMGFLKEGYFGAVDRSGALVAIESIEFPGDDSMINNEVQYYPREYNWFMSQDIVQYRIKEDWFFDKERSVLDVRIIGLAPVTYAIDEATGQITGYKELFWLYFPECRYVFQNFFVQDRQNDAQRMSFDDLFWKRMFQSYIVKQSNLYDREIDSYKAGVDALLESERIKEDIFTFEHDLWNF
jgi:gliding motility associated protien GldN